MALQIKTWCHLQQISAVGFNVSLSEVCWVQCESVRSLLGVSQESVRSQSGVGQKSVRSLMATKFDGLILKALQIWRADLDGFPN